MLDFHMEQQNGRIVNICDIMRKLNQESNKNFAD